MTKPNKLTDFLKDTVATVFNSSILLINKNKENDNRTNLKSEKKGINECENNSSFNKKPMEFNKLEVSNNDVKITHKNIGNVSEIKDKNSNLKVNSNKLEVNDNNSNLKVNNSSFSSSNWSIKDDIVQVKKSEYQEMVSDLYDKTQIIKKFKERDEANKTIIEEYENTLIFLTKSNAGTLKNYQELNNNENRTINDNRDNDYIKNSKIIDNIHTLSTFNPNNSLFKSSNDRLLEELDKLKCNENRMKSHIKALKKDLIIIENERDEMELKNNLKIEELHKEIERLKDKIKDRELQIIDLKFSNKRVDERLEKRSEEIIELSEIIRELLKDFI